MLLEIHPENPEKRKIRQVVDILEKGGVIIYPTDTVYGLGCDIYNRKAYERICRIRGIKPEKANFSFVCSDLTHMSEFTLPFNNTAFKTMKATLPGPYTYILKASGNVPKMFKNKKRTVGLRLPDHPITLAIMEELGRPILSASIKSDDEIIQYPTDPWEIYEEYGKIVDVVIDGGFGNNIPSTVVDFTDDEPVVIREGAGSVEPFY